MKGNFGGFCRFLKTQLCQEKWCDECQIYEDWRKGLYLAEKEVKKIEKRSKD